MSYYTCNCGGIWESHIALWLWYRLATGQQGSQRGQCFDYISANTEPNRVIQEPNYSCDLCPFLECLIIISNSRLGKYFGIYSINTEPIWNWWPVLEILSQPAFYGYFWIILNSGSNNACIDLGKYWRWLSCKVVNDISGVQIQGLILAYLKSLIYLWRNGI